jgi:hypothetical protein
MGKKYQALQKIPALKVRQWLDAWDDFEFDEAASQAAPDPHFYMFSLQASHLKRLTGVYRRSTRGKKPRAKDPNVQRGHQEARSNTIREFVQFGYPWCEMGASKRNVSGAVELRKPGWLPTAILVNILEPQAERNGETIPDSDLITVIDGNGGAEIVLPANYTGKTWEPSKVYPLEVIDGQHRLWAFEGFDPGDDFELPVVAFHGLDRSWQAYLFWSVNITPKRINRSLAYDLYPLLRREDWLDRFAGHAIYRETRSQELVEALWGHPESPWNQRINMLGETVAQRESAAPMVSQAAWVRSLMASFIKEWVEGGTRIGGLFGAPRSADESFLPWNRAMQAAFLIHAGSALCDEIDKSKAEWAEYLRAVEEEELFVDDDDRAFHGKYSLLTTDQGIRGFLRVTNDLCFVHWDELRLDRWRWDDVERTSAKDAAATDERAVSAALKSLAEQPVSKFISQIARGLATFDWRTSSAPELPPEIRRQQAVFRGSGGYKQLRIELLEHLSSAGISAALDDAAKRVLENE